MRTHPPPQRWGDDGWVSESNGKRLMKKLHSEHCSVLSKGWSENSRRPELDAYYLTCYSLEDMILHYVENCYYSGNYRWCTVFFHCLIAAEIFFFFSDLTTRKNILCFSDWTRCQRCPVTKPAHLVHIIQRLNHMWCTRISSRRETFSGGRPGEFFSEYLKTKPT